MAKWYAVMENRDDTDWGYGSHDLEEAKQMLIDKGFRSGYVAVIENDLCIEELTQDDLFGEDVNRKWGAITVEEFKKAVEVFGFESAVVTAIWNTMQQNPNNQDEFETVYALYTAGRFATYRNADTGETFTYDELTTIKDQFGYEMSYKCFDDFVDTLERVD